MKPHPASLEDLLARIVSAIDEIFAFTEDMDESAFHADRRTQLAVAFDIVAIGEASRSMLRRYPEFVAQHPDWVSGDIAVPSSAVSPSPSN